MKNPRLLSIRTSRRRISAAPTTRAVALGMALAAVVAIHPAGAAPGDIFSVSAPASSGAAPAASSIADNDSSVAEQTGAFQYSYKIAVPPGRNGMQPHLALNYSSQAPIYGTIAAGWSLSIPGVYQDTSQGRLAGKTYMSTLAGGRPLIAVTEEMPTGAAQGYRAQSDTTYARYDRMNTGNGYQWRADLSDGSTYYFGDTDSHYTGGCSIFSDAYAPLTRTSDLFGNVVEYLYEPGVDGECHIKEIDWGKNGTTIGHFAKVVFGYGLPAGCAPNATVVGGLTSYRTGTKIVSAAVPLQTITATAFDPGTLAVAHTRQITLGYDSAASSCSAPYSAYRSLTSISESAWGTSSPRVDVPPVTFTYSTPATSWPNVTSSNSPPWSEYENSPSAAYSARFNLGWGFRYNGTKWPTVEAMMLDIDGDGLLDRVISRPQYDATGTHIQRCQFVWERNRGPSFTTFAPAQAVPIPLPMLKWATKNGDPRYSDGLMSNVNGTTNEGCSLNYQETNYANSHNGGAICPGDTDPNSCKTGSPTFKCNTGRDCILGSSSGSTVLAYRWVDLDGDGLVDLVASVAKGGLSDYNLEQGNGILGDVIGPIEPALFGVWPACPTTATTIGTLAGANTRCGGMYPWFFYRNQGNGQFGTIVSGAVLPTQIQYRPAPLEMQQSDSAIIGYPQSANAGVVDLDGDGVPDFAAGSGYSPSNVLWNLYRHSSVGSYDPATISTFQYNTRTNAALIQTGNVVSGDSSPVQLQGLLDLNGDGLVDQWQAPIGGGATNIAVNDGTTFQLASGQGLISISTRPGTDGVAGIDSTLGTFVDTGYRSDGRRAIDLDGDGRVDLVDPALTSTTRFNQGGDFTSTTSVTEPNEPNHHYVIVSHNIDQHGNSSASYSWEIRSDMLDLDGDGILDGVTFGPQRSPASTMLISRSAVQAPRAMTTIDNGRGATTTIIYASMQDPLVVAQDPTHNYYGHPAADFATQWITKRTSTHDYYSNTTALTSYKYALPAITYDERSRSAFRGFQRVEVTKPSPGQGRTGATIATVYDYSIDPTGQISEQYVHAGETTTGVTESTITTWESRTLVMPAAVTSYHATQIQHSICSNGATEATCHPGQSGVVGYTRTLNNIGFYPTAAPRMLLHLGALTTTTLPGAPATDGDRNETTSYQAAISSTSYRVRPVLVSNTRREGGIDVAYASTHQTWDAALSLHLSTEVSFDAATTATTKFVQDPVTGNVIKRTRPNQSVSGISATYDYDTRALFVVTEHRETTSKGTQVITYQYEYGSGIKTGIIGPNIAPCTYAIGGCDARTTGTEQHIIHVDGIGRTTDHYETFMNDGSSYYVLAKDHIYTYTGMTTLTHQHAIDGTVGIGGATVRYASDVTNFDGHGRVIQKYIPPAGLVSVNAMTTYTYNDNGTIATVVAPDPSANDASTVEYDYTTDSLGRTTSVRRPDFLTATTQSGVDTAFNGLVTITTEHQGTGGGQSAVTTQTRDAFGRLARVDETYDAFGALATTQYEYGPVDNVTKITDPDGNVTTLAQDFAGHRTSITRASGTWTYGYDLDGNLVSEIVPGCVSPYTNCISTITYDPLDRPTSRINAHRTLSAADLALFGADHETFQYGTGAKTDDSNDTGRLAIWSSFAPTGTAQLTVEPSFDGQGHQVQNYQSAFGLAGLPTLHRSFEQFYDMGGTPSLAQYDDALGGTNTTTSRMHMDARGYPGSIDILAPPAATITLTNTRNVAGLVTRQQPTGAAAVVESDWTYDRLGRVASQAVLVSGTQVARQNLAYFGLDDPTTMDQYLPTGHRQLSYTYDRRHQISTATETTSSGSYFTGSYTFGTAGRLSTASESSSLPPGSGVKPRNVSYQYNNVDKEQVTGLITGSTPYANYAYDPTGNVTMKCMGAITSGSCSSAESWAFVYDGRNQLRRATHFGTTGLVLDSEEYWYDFSGLRVLTLKRDTSGNKIELIWKNEGTEAHYDSSGALTHVYSYVNFGAEVARVDRTSNTTTDVEYSYQGQDSSPLISVGATTGTPTSYASFSPFGEVLESYDSTGWNGHSRGLNDKVADGSGLTYYGARYFDTVSLMWTQPDPLFRLVPELSALSTPRRANLFSFSLNNPLKYIDRDGLSAVWNPGTPTEADPFPHGDPHCNGVTSLCDEGQQQGPGGAEPDVVDGLRDVVDAKRVVPRMVEALGGGIETLGDASRSTLLDMVPIYGTYRCFSRGDYLSGALGLFGDGFLLFGAAEKFASTAGSEITWGVGAAMAPLPKMTREIISKRRLIAEGRDIRKADELVSKFGGEAKKWKKYAAPVGNTEVHWYEHPGIGRRGLKWEGFPDPF